MDDKLDRLLLMIFQSTLPQGERLQSAKLRDGLFKFQSTLPQGERHGWPFTTDTMIPFQSTLPQGERRYTTDLVTIWYKYFNPRSRKGSD